MEALNRRSLMKAAGKLTGAIALADANTAVAADKMVGLAPKNATAEVASPWRADSRTENPVEILRRLLSSSYASKSMLRDMRRYDARIEALHACSRVYKDSMQREVLEQERIAEGLESMYFYNRSDFEKLVAHYKLKDFFGL